MRESYRDLYEGAARQLKEAGVTEARLDAWYLFEDCFKMDRGHYFLYQTKEAESPERVSRFLELVRQRSSRIPLQYILGQQEFMGLSFFVNEQVLIPRQDTEILCERVLKDYAGRQKNLKLLDMCTGSGCILLSLMKLGPFLEGTGVDCMPQALAVAGENARRLGVPAQWVQSDLFSAVPEKEYDVIVSNPPYISGRELAQLEPEVREHEPRVALFAPEDGLFFYCKIARESMRYLKPGGRIYVEIGCGQSAAVSAFFCQAGFTQIETCKDLAGLDRVVSACKTGENKNV